MRENPVAPIVLALGVWLIFGTAIFGGYTKPDVSEGWAVTGSEDPASHPTLVRVARR